MAKVLVTTRMHESIRQKILDAGLPVRLAERLAYGS